MHEAASSYPEAPGLAIAAEMFDESAAFERKDYDAFLEMAQKEWKRFPGPATAAELSSALACKYAVTGNADFRKQSEDMLRVAEQQVQGDPMAMKDFQEYAERTRYRLESREIIGREEYNRRFRGGQNRKN